MSKTVLNDINAFIKDYAGKDMGEKEWYGIDLEYGYFVLCKYFNVSKTFESTINLFDTSGNLIMDIFVDSIVKVYKMEKENPKWETLYSITGDEKPKLKRREIKWKIKKSNVEYFPFVMDILDNGKELVFGNDDDLENIYKLFDKYDYLELTSNGMLYGVKNDKFIHFTDNLTDGEPMPLDYGFMYELDLMYERIKEVK